MSTIPATVSKVIEASGLSRAVLPARVPLSLVITAEAGAGFHSMQDELLGAVKRRVVYRRTYLTIQILGLMAAWIGALSKGVLVTNIGVVAGLAGAVLSFIDRDRITSLDDRISELAKRQQRLVAEWLAMVLEIGEYAYAKTGPAGKKKWEILSSRKSLFPDDVVDRLTEWLKSEEAGVAAAVRWSAIQQHLGELAGINSEGQRLRRSVSVWLDSVHVVLFALLLIVAFVTASLTIPSTVMVATVASVITLSARSATDAVTSVLAKSDRLEPQELTDVTLVVSLRRLGVAELGESDLERLSKSSFLVRRTLSGRTEARIRETS